MKEITRETQCWDYQNCPPERKANCPAYTTNQGRICFSVSKTLCKGEVQDNFANKIEKCRECAFGQVIGA